MIFEMCPELFSPFKKDNLRIADSIHACKFKEFMENKLE